jgi:two-component system NtrC family sensor kinase
MKEKANRETPVSDQMSLSLAIVGGGRACRFFLELFRLKSFNNFNIKIAGVCDINPNAEGLRLAKEMGIYTTNDFRDLFKIKDLDAIIELTGSREVLLELTGLKPKGLAVVEHNFSKVLRDYLLTGQKLQVAEEEIALEKMASDFLMQQTNERILVLNPDFSIADANEAYLKAVEKERKGVIGAHCYEITHRLPVPCSSVNPALGCPLVETLRTGESAHVIHEHTSPGQPPTYCDLVTYPLKDQKGKINRVIEIWRDITDELSARLETKVNALKADLQKLIQEDRMISLGKLVASSVHEINNPIQGLLTFSGLMQDILEEEKVTPEDLDKFKKYLSLMSRELERCGNIVSGLLSFSRHSDMKYADVDLNDILEQVTALTRHKMEIQGIHLSTELYAHPLVVNGDLTHLQQCFLNLIFNAMEAMPEGGQLSVISELDVPNNSALVRIQDTGPGIAVEHLDHIFDPFFTTKEEREGTGLGLSIVYGVVKNHGGEIKVDSRLGKGTTFVLTIPVR